MAVKRLHKDLARFYTETLGHRLPNGPPNLTAIAKDGNVDETIKVRELASRRGGRLSSRLCLVGQNHCCGGGTERPQRGLYHGYAGDDAEFTDRDHGAYHTGIRQYEASG